MRNGVSSKRLLKRIAIVLAGAAMFLVFIALAQGRAHASPIPPDVRKLAEQPQGPPPKFEPARAGWNGPESGPPPALPTEFSAAARVRAVRRTLALLMTPDPKALLAIALLIVVLRVVRAREERKARKPAVQPPEWQVPQAA
ncbi:MAG: hypothetical protein HYX28_05310 [Candidatus Koribacter versatilis]|uniref:Uncharacterized protein n=1 Tax=Candidatus Korobacter versatilis TaxID=658062 RepID=A0A932EPX8_9BACT|nr:hypothetical protein [Candidatus Koribacter versatilis]